MNKVLWLTLLDLVLHFSVMAQANNKAEKDAFVIILNGCKLHVQTQAIDDSFSLVLYDVLINEIDEDKLLFTTDDIKLLAVYHVIYTMK